MVESGDTIRGKPAAGGHFNAWQPGGTMPDQERLLLVVVMMLAIVGVDAMCGPEVSPWAAYVVPVALAARLRGFRTAAVYAVLAGLLICVAARHSGHPYSSGFYFLVAAGSQTLVLLVIAWLVSRLSALEQALRAVLTSGSALSPSAG